MEQPAQWQSYLPLVVIAAIFALRLRNVNRDRRLRLGQLLVAPLIVAMAAVFVFTTMALDWTGLAIMGAGLVAGAALGWQRARLMKIAYDPVSATFTIRQSPFALVLLIGVIVLRRLAMGAATGPGPHSAAMAPQAVWTIDGLIGFGLAMVVTTNTELWLRARKLRAEGGLQSGVAS